MINIRSILDVADNTGAKRISCIGVIGKKNKKCAHIGDVITANVKEVVSGDSQIKKGEVVRAVIVRTAHPIMRDDGVWLKFDRNACVIIDKQGNPRGTRVFGPVARELRDKFSKIISLAPEVI
ncbi:MAG: 50S ribosomal protein L14 [Candidatus Omnitrophica bacterium]|nr:50S ribosomal protein L14 [Candidatus Omnitrophota bacterium]MCM8824344.1 50S ribosomal protein L14 [Candidatus Omnitrophota bacterium]MCM8826863.1 50S ribosomal protein L14 [Candidatus Omnitrophota bacterium]